MEHLGHAVNKCCITSTFASFRTFGFLPSNFQYTPPFYTYLETAIQGSIQLTSNGFEAMERGKPENMHMNTVMRGHLYL